MEDFFRADKTVNEAQSCTELESSFAAIADRTDKLNDLFALGGDDEGGVFTINRQVFIHEALLLRLEQRKSAKDFRQRAKARSESAPESR